MSLSILSACGDDVLLDGGTGSASASSSSLSAQSDYVPSLGPGLSPGDTRTGPVVDDGWNPFPETSTGDGLPTPSGRASSPGPGSTPAPSSSSSVGVRSSPEPTTPTDPTPSDSSDSTRENRSNTTNSSETSFTGTSLTGTSSDTTSSSETGSSTLTVSTGSMGTSTGSESSTGSPTRDPEPVDSDPMGTQFGLRIELSIGAPFPKTQDLRALVFTFDAQAVQPTTTGTSQNPVSEVAAQPQIQAIQPAPYQPQLPFNGDGKTALVLPTPLDQELEAQTRRSKPHAITVYRDLNGDGEWNEREPFVAALPQTLSYIGGTPGKAERWVMNPNAASLINPPSEDPIPAVLELTRLDRFRVPAKLEGYTNSLGKHADFVAMLSTAEVLDLDTNFVPTLRAFDVNLRSLPEGPFTLPAPTLPPMPRTGLPSVEIPGIRPAFTATRWLMSYRRPLGAPVEAPGEFLTRDSTLIAGVCVSRGFNAGKQGSFYRELLALWLDDGAWAIAPQGALYAAWLNLGVGWNFVPIATSQNTLPWVDAASAMAPGQFFSPTWEHGDCSSLMR